MTEEALLSARSPEVVASAPGRVNLLGEHTDYNGGFVLPTVIPQRTSVALSRRSDRSVVARSRQYAEPQRYQLGEERRSGTWLDYVQGVTRALEQHGCALSGFDVEVSSDVPVGAGLSSSAALEVALLRGLRQLFALGLPDLDLARLAQWGENHVVGAPVGILDPMACHLADAATALFLDTHTLEFERLPMPEDLELVVVDSGVRHDHATGGYKTRRAECERAAAALGVSSLREVAPDDPRVAQLPPPLDRRARHVLTENARVLAAAEALRERRSTLLGALFAASHASMRDDFEVSVPEVDALVDRARGDSLVLGARLTGGGFGGAVVCLVERGSALAVGRRLASGSARLLVPMENATC